MNPRTPRQVAPGDLVRVEHSSAFWPSSNHLACNDLYELWYANNSAPHLWFVVATLDCFIAIDNKALLFSRDGFAWVRQHHLLVV